MEDFELTEKDVADILVQSFGDEDHNCSKCYAQENGYCYEHERYVEPMWGCIEFDLPVVI